MKHTETTASRNYFLHDKERNPKSASQNLRSMLIDHEDPQPGLEEVSCHKIMRMKTKLQTQLQVK